MIPGCFQDAPSSGSKGKRPDEETLIRFLALFLLGFAALAEEGPNPEILKWRAEAQARERAISRRPEVQPEKARAAQRRVEEKKPAASAKRQPSSEPLRHGGGGGS